MNTKSNIGVKSRLSFATHARQKDEPGAPLVSQGVNEDELVLIKEREKLGKNGSLATAMELLQPQIQTNGNEHELSKFQRLSKTMENKDVRDPFWTDRRKTVMILLAMVTSFVAFFYISIPSDVIFDEIHYANQIQHTLLHAYYFDTMPPFSKIFYAGIAWISGYTDNVVKRLINTGFSAIGQDYSSQGFPFIACRSVTAGLGVLNVVLLFAICLLLNMPDVIAFFTACLCVFDNASILQSRLMMGDTLFVTLMLTMLFSWLQYKRTRSIRWLVLTGMVIGMSSSAKVIGFAGWFLMIAFGAHDIYTELKATRSFLRLKQDLAQKILCLLALPTLAYLSVYYVHFSLLYRSGPGDQYMSPGFQQSLLGNAFTHQSRQLSPKPVFYSQTLVLLKNKAEPIYLHSHLLHYPVKHMDGKTSSAEQQVTGYPRSSDTNNLWVFEMMVPQTNSTTTTVPRQVGNGDIVRLKHVNTGKYLLTHDVASPLTLTNMEVIAFPNPEPETPTYNHTLWRLDFAVPVGTSLNDSLALKLETGGHTMFRLLHYMTGIALHNHQQSLPEWGFHQREINGLKLSSLELLSLPTFWTVMSEEIATKVEAEGEEETISMSFMSKWFEHEVLFWRANAGAAGQHPYTSPAWSWPLMLKGVSLWDHYPTHRQLYLIGNPLVWWMALTGSILFTIYLFKNRKTIHTHAKWMYAAYWSYFGPYFFVSPSKMLFLNAYFPALHISFCMTGLIISAFYSKQSQRGKMMTKLGLSTALIMIMISFWYWRHLTYALPMTTEEGRARQWLPTWHYLVTLHPIIIP